MRDSLGRILAGLALGAGAVLGALALDLVPARTPDAPIETPFDPANLVERSSDRAAEKPASDTPELAPPRAAPLSVFRVPVCEAPAQGTARIYRVSLAEGHEAHFIWCRGGFQRLDFALDAGGLRVQRIARFPSRAELPGGVTAADFDGDRLLDLLLGTASPASTVHRPGAGAFYVRGRQAGGFEAARALIEMPVVGVEALPSEGDKGHDFLVLTRGDTTAQRPGELWRFTGGVAFRKLWQLPVGLGPRDLVLVADTQNSVLIAQPSASSVLRLALSAAEAAALPTKQSLSVPGVQGLMVDSARTQVFARDARDLKQLHWGAELSAQSWAEGANVGPGVLVDFDGDGQLEVLARVAGGIAHAQKGASEEQMDELELPGDTLDVSTLQDAARRSFPLVLATVPGTQELVVLVLPPPPWQAGRTLAFQGAEVTEGPGLAVVALE